jgi:predicted DCC family thiol-disulfide oxidoreductase YuxK
MTVALYDGMCVICNQTRRIVTVLDWRKRVEWLDVHRWDEVARRYPEMDYQTAMGQIHVVEPNGTVHVGFFGTRRLLLDLPLAYPLWLLLQLPPLAKLGQVVYRFIARNRYTINRWMGMPICDDGACRIPD